MKRYRLFLSLLAGCLLAGCNDEDRFSMEADELAGSWWKETELYIFEEGSDTWAGKENVFGHCAGCISTTLYFDSARQVTQYVPINVGLPKYYRTSAFDYDPHVKTVSTELFGPAVEVKRFTHSCMEFKITESGSSFSRSVFRRYTPTEKELEEFASYIDYESYLNYLNPMQ